MMLACAAPGWKTEEAYIHHYEGCFYGACIQRVISKHHIGAGLGRFYSQILPMVHSSQKAFAPPAAPVVVLLNKLAVAFPIGLLTTGL